MSPLLPTLPGLIAEQIGLALPDLGSCEGASGRFDLKELRQIGAKPPAVRVGLLRVGDGMEVSGPAYHHPLRFAAYVITADRGGLDRDDAALAIVERLIGLIHGNAWGSDCLGEPMKVSADNLYSAGARGQGVAMWGVAWDQEIQIGARPVSAGALPAEWYARGLGPGDTEALVVDTAS
ncbi:MAG: hypothetical protein AAGI34_09805 [Pseudomonadota bacterium]